MALAETASPSVTRPSPARRGRDLVHSGLFHRLVARVRVDESVDVALAERICDQALAFLQVCADNPGRTFAPSPSVDAGWHAFLLHTHDYAAFCDAKAGRFIHHIPTDNGDGGDGPMAADAVEAIRSAGFVVDAELWPAAGTRCRCQRCQKCHQCHAGCHDSP